MQCSSSKWCRHWKWFTVSPLSAVKCAPKTYSVEMTIFDLICNLEWFWRILSQFALIYIFLHLYICIFVLIIVFILCHSKIFSIIYQPHFMQFSVRRMNFISVTVTEVSSVLPCSATPRHLLKLYVSGHRLEFYCRLYNYHVYDTLKVF